MKYWPHTGASSEERSGDESVYSDLSEALTYLCSLGARSTGSLSTATLRGEEQEEPGVEGGDTGLEQNVEAGILQLEQFTEKLQKEVSGIPNGDFMSDELREEANPESDSLGGSQVAERDLVTDTKEVAVDGHTEGIGHFPSPSEGQVDTGTEVRYLSDYIVKPDVNSWLNSGSSIQEESTEESQTSPGLEPVTLREPEPLLDAHQAERESKDIKELVCELEAPETAPNSREVSGAGLGRPCNSGSPEIALDGEAACGGQTGKKSWGRGGGSRPPSLELEQRARESNARMEDRWAEVKTSSWSGQLDWERRGEVGGQGETHLGPPDLVLGGGEGLERSSSCSGLQGSLGDRVSSSSKKVWCRMLV